MSPRGICRRIAQAEIDGKMATDAGKFDDSALVSMWEEFVDRYARGALSQLAGSYPNRKSLVLNYEDVQKFNPELADMLIDKPDVVLGAAEKAVWGMQAGMPGSSFEPHVRVSELPDNNLLIMNVSSTHIDHLISLKGVVTKRADVLHKVKVALYRCLMCAHVMRVPMTKKAVVPEVCPECKRRSLKLDEEGSYFVDIQRAEVQELLERLSGGTPASHIELLLEDDLVNTLTPGDNVIVTGVLRLRPPLKNKGKNEQAGIYTRYLDVVNAKNMKIEFEDIDINDEEIQRIRELSTDPQLYPRVFKTVAPAIYGHDSVKEAVALQLFGGTKEKTLISGEKIRDDIHILLVGDPGAAKTRFLQHIKELAPKSIYVSGKSVTGVGLTASAEKDELGEGGWTLKAGALVLATGGIACVDEFDKIDDEDRASMHEVMESQTVSIAKAGIVARFKAKSAILAAANPKHGRFDKNRLPAEQFEIPPTLLSRFDLIFVIFDVLDEVRDGELAEKILTSHREGTLADKTPIEGLIERDIFRKYVAFARKNCKPVLSRDASDILKTYYVELRKRGAQQGAVPITPRQIEGLVRLAEASAKIRLSNEVTVDDAKRATRLSQYVLDEIMRDKETGRIDVDIIQTGKPKSQVDKINTIIGITKELQKQYDLVEINKIIERCAEYKIDEITARRIIDELVYKGDLYKARPGFVKTVDNYE